MLVIELYALEVEKIDSKFVSLLTWDDSNTVCPNVFPVYLNIPKCYWNLHHLGYCSVARCISDWRNYLAINFKMSVFYLALLWLVISLQKSEEKYFLSVLIHYQNIKWSHSDLNIKLGYLSESLCFHVSVVSQEEDLFCSWRKMSQFFLYLAYTSQNCFPSSIQL